jgi:hypothetical protein
LAHNLSSCWILRYWTTNEAGIGFMLKTTGKVILVNLIILMVLFGLAELTFRVLYPEFTNDIHSSGMTFGRKMHTSRFYGIDMRVPYEAYNIEVKKDVPIMLILGDSITMGYGNSYEEMYQHRLERLLNINSRIKVISLAGYGNGLFDIAKELEQLLSRSGHKLNIKYIVYQFNFNDITPFNAEALKKGDHLAGIENTDLFFKIARLRYKYLNHSTFMRVLQYYAGRIIRKTHGTCEERGFDALGQYTWTFGCKPYKSRSEELWKEFDKSVLEVKKFADKISAKFVIFISPTLYDIDVKGVHPYYNPYNLDFSCATIDPRKRLVELGRKYNIDIIDPKDYVKKHFENLVREGNFTPFFFPADSNHFTPVTSGYIAEYLYKYFSQQKDWQKGVINHDSLSNLK